MDPTRDQLKSRTIKEFRGITGLVGKEAVVASIYDSALYDTLDFTNLEEEEMTDRLERIVLDLMLYRFNTLTLEGIQTETQAGVSTAYNQDIPQRIKRKLRSHRRLP